MSLSNIPPKGTADWWPDEFAIRRYIFDNWRRVNQIFGYDEYLTPLLEMADVYRAKSGEDVGGKELMTMTDRGGRELAIRPEMTPSVTRMVSRYYKQAPKPLRLFSIANFYRNERPQRGRNREFWQLNTDIFGSTSLLADLEILQVALELMLAFEPPAGSFVLYLNHRQLINAIMTDIAQAPTELITETARLLDKYNRIKSPKFEQALLKLGLTEAMIRPLIQFMKCRTSDELLAQFPELADSSGFQETSHLIKELEALGYGDWIQFNPGIIRGFDYYDGMVFEMFDTHPQNNRALFGGGRYNGLAGIFGGEDIPAVGFAPGDETTRLFLESWDLLPEETAVAQRLYLPLLDDSLAGALNYVAQQLRQADFAVESGIETQNFRQALSYANKQGFHYVLLLGPDEAAKDAITIKNMRSGDQNEVSQVALVKTLRNTIGQQK